MTACTPRWDEAQLGADRRIATQRFRDERIGEPRENYQFHYRDASRVFRAVLARSRDLRDVRGAATELLTDKDSQDLCRYLAGPPLSEDDLRTLADCSLTPGVLARNPDGVATVMEFILAGVDHERFPWLAEDREPTEPERQAALVATCALYAARRTETWRRNHGGKSLERLVKEYLRSAGLSEVPAATISNSSQGPQAGQFCGETSVAGGKADLVVRLFDGRLLPIECKVSNSETNSYKRLIHDCGEKAQAWVATLGPANCVPMAALSGCYSLGNLRKAQDMGLTLVWAHALDPLGAFIEATRA